MTELANEYSSAGRLRRGAAIFVVTAVLLAEHALAQANELKVMSFNIRYSHGGNDEEKSENNWTDAKYPRRERAVRVIREHMPDVLGVQEARELQIIDLREALPEYEFYGVGRDDGKTEGEYAGIFYREKRFSRIDAGSFWLSETPQRPGTSFYKVPDAVPRMASWVRLRDKHSCASFIVLNTHWDHISEEARRKSAALIRERLPQLSKGSPAIVMGDFNGSEDTPELQDLLQGEGALLDSYRKLNPNPSPDESTFGGWTGERSGRRIDFILYTKEFAPLSAAIIRSSYAGRWPSDHYPVTVTLRFGPAAK